MTNQQKYQPEPILRNQGIQPVQLQNYAQNQTNEQVYRGEANRFTTNYSQGRLQGQQQQIPNYQQNYQPNTIKNQPPYQDLRINGNNAPNALNFVPQDYGYNQKYN